jgi:hypothetical protein
MTAFRRAVRALSGIGLGLALSLGLAACHLLPGTPATRSWVQLRPVGPSLLVVLLDPDSPSALAAFRETLIRTSRGHERVIVISTDSGRPLGSFRTPAGPSVRIPGPPPPLPNDPTPLQLAARRQQLAAFHGRVHAARTRLGRQEAGGLAAWAGRVAAAAGRAALYDHPGRGAPGFARAADAAAADVRSLDQAEPEVTTRTVFAVIGYDGAGVSRLLGGMRGVLPGSTFVLTGFPADPVPLAAWTAALRRARARTALLLTQATGGLLERTVNRGLDGAGYNPSS